jgi:hypothetical protein
LDTYASHLITHLGFRYSCWVVAAVQATSRPIDPALILLIGLLLASLAAFFLGFIPYPYGLLIPAAFITARTLGLRSIGKTNARVMTHYGTIPE